MLFNLLDYAETIAICDSLIVYILRRGPKLLA